MTIGIPSISAAFRATILLAAVCVFVQAQTQPSQTIPPVPQLVAIDGFDPTLLAALQTALDETWQTLVTQADIPLQPPAVITIGPSTNEFDSTGCSNGSMPANIYIVPFKQTLPKTDSPWAAFFHEVEHALGCGYRFDTPLEESWATALQANDWNIFAENGVFFPAGTVFTYAQGGQLKSFLATPAMSFGASNNLRSAVFGTGEFLVSPVPDSSAPWLSLAFDAFHGVGGSAAITQAAGKNPNASVAQVLQSLANDSGKPLNINGLPPGIFFGNNLMEFPAVLDNITVVGLRELWMTAGAGAGDGWEVDYLSFQKGTPSPQGGTGNFTIDTGVNTRVIASGTVTIDPTSGKGYILFSEIPSLQVGGNLMLATGSYHVVVTMQDANGLASTNPLLTDEDVFVVPVAGETWPAGKIVIVENGDGGTFGSIAPWCDLESKTVGIASYGPGLCVVTLQPNADGTFPDVTVTRENSPIVATFTVPMAGGTIAYFLAKPLNAWVNGITHLDGTNAKVLVGGEIVAITGAAFTRNEPTFGPRLSPPPTSGCPGTATSDQGRTEVWFTGQDGTLLAKAGILDCSVTETSVPIPGGGGSVGRAISELIVVVPSGLPLGETVNVSVVVNGGASLNAVSLPVAAADPDVLAAMDANGNVTVYATDTSLPFISVIDGRRMRETGTSGGATAQPQSLTLYVTGLGANPTVATVTATVGGQSAPVVGVVSELLGYPGLCEVILTTPAGLTGSEPIIITVAGVSSPAVTLTLHSSAPPPPLRRGRAHPAPSDEGRQSGVASPSLL